MFQFVCNVDQMHIVKGRLQSLKYNIKSAEFEFVPKLKVVLTDEQLEGISKLIDKLEEHPDIVNIYDNIA